MLMAAVTGTVPGLRLQVMHWWWLFYLRSCSGINMILFHWRMYHIKSKPRQRRGLLFSMTVHPKGDWSSNLFIGAGLTKERTQIDLNAKYALFQQTPGKIPVSITYFGNMVIDARDKSNFRYSVHRFSYFNQLIIARKITDKFSAQVAPNFSWYNNVEAYVNSKGEIEKKMNNYHFAFSVAGRYKVSKSMALIAGYDQPLTQHLTNNPDPNISFGLEITTSSHAFQVFAGNYYSIVPQSNNVFNQNNYRDGQFLIGFNITRLWNF